MKPSALAAASLCLGLTTLVVPQRSAFAWETHSQLMRHILRGIEKEASATGTITPALAALQQPIAAPSPEEDRATYLKLAAEFKLNPATELPPTAPEAAARRQPTTGLEILSGTVVDDPDHGMDRDLPYPPQEYDPDGFQRWMGGKTGPSSQGFRHMYFGGWQLWHPLKTFQIPSGPIGLAPQRLALMAMRARELIRAGGAQAAWGFRLLGWAMHYAQDLTQPFHAVQIPSTRMVPWNTALQWPPKQGFEELVRETTRTISNYHWAYEGYVRTRVQESPSPFDECLENPNAFALLADDARKGEALNDPLQLGHRTAKASVRIAAEVGRANVALFGAELKQRGVDLRDGKGEPNYAELALRPDLVEQREGLRKVTCIALGNAAWVSRALLDWATRP